MGSQSSQFYNYHKFRPKFSTIMSTSTLFSANWVCKPDGPSPIKLIEFSKEKQVKVTIQPKLARKSFIVDLTKPLHSQEAPMTGKILVDFCRKTVDFTSLRLTDEIFTQDQRDLYVDVFGTGREVCIPRDTSFAVSACPGSTMQGFSSLMARVVALKYMLGTCVEQAATPSNGLYAVLDKEAADLQLMSALSG